MIDSYVRQKRKIKRAKNIWKIKTHTANFLYIHTFIFINHTCIVTNNISK